MQTVARLTGKVLTGILIAATLALVALLLVLPRMTGGAALTVLSGSMEPTIPVGSVILIRPIEPQAVERGDVITYQAAPGVRELITHRVIEVQPETDPLSFITKGDANKGEDLEPIPAGAVRGEVWFHVPWVGYAAEQVEGRRGVALMGIFAGLALLIHVLRTLTSPNREATAGSQTEADPKKKARGTHVEVT